MSARPPAGAPDPTPGGAGSRPPAGSPEAEAELVRQAAGDGEIRAEREPAEAEEAQVERDLDELLRQTRSERDEYLELAQRTQADFENYRRRVGRESEEAERRARAKLASELIGVLDNLERALVAAGIDPAAATVDDDGGDGALARGVLLTFRELQSVLGRAGVEAYDPAGERFDPKLHEALQTRSEDGAESGLVLEVVEKGYRLDGQVLRPARVIVSD